MHSFRSQEEWASQQASVATVRTASRPTSFESGMFTTDRKQEELNGKTWKPAKKIFFVKYLGTGHANKKQLACIPKIKKKRLGIREIRVERSRGMGAWAGSKLWAIGCAEVAGRPSGPMYNVANGFDGGLANISQHPKLCWCYYSGGFRFINECCC